MCIRDRTGAGHFNGPSDVPHLSVLMAYNSIVDWEIIIIIPTSTGTTKLVKYYCSVLQLLLLCLIFTVNAFLLNKYWYLLIHTHTNVCPHKVYILTQSTPIIFFALFEFRQSNKKNLLLKFWNVYVLHTDDITLISALKLFLTLFQSMDNRSFAGHI